LRSQGVPARRGRRLAVQPVLTVAAVARPDRCGGVERGGDGSVCSVPVIGEMTEGEGPAVVRLWETCGLTRPWNDPTADLDQARRGATSTVLVARDYGV